MTETGCLIELEDMLAARERRAAKRISFAQDFQCTVVSFTMNIPGPQKAGALIERGFDEGFQEFLNALEREGFALLCAEAYYLPTGPEGYFAVNADAEAVKKIAVGLEEKHPLGRLFDMDVMNKGLKPISRKDIGISARRCLLCQEDAKVCGRSRRHYAGELKAEADRMMQAYYEQQDA